MNSLNRLIAYFDLFSMYRSDIPEAQGKGEDQPNANIWLIVHYVALYLGILSKLFLDSVQSRNQTEISVISPYSLVFSFIVATAIFPATYQKTFGQPEIHKKAQMGPEPNIVQVCMTFTAGLGYQALLGAAIGG